MATKRKADTDSDDALLAQSQTLGKQIDDLRTQRRRLADELRARAEQRGGFLSNVSAHDDAIKE